MWRWDELKFQARMEWANPLNRAFVIALLILMTAFVVMIEIDNSGCCEDFFHGVGGQHQEIHKPIER